MVGAGLHGALARGPGCLPIRDVRTCRETWPVARGPIKVYIQSSQSSDAVAMKASRIKPISYFKANAAEIVRQLAENREPMVITQNGEATAIIQDIASYEETQETMALLKILALGNRQIEAGRVTPAATAIKHLRQRMGGQA